MSHFFAPFVLLHGEVGHVGVGGDLDLEDGLGGGGAPVEHRAEDRGEGVARHDGGLDGELLDERFGLLQTRSSPTSPTSARQDAAAPSEVTKRNFHALKSAFFALGCGDLISVTSKMKPNQTLLFSALLMTRRQSLMRTRAETCVCVCA